MSAATRPITRLLAIVLAIGVSRWLEAKWGWPEFLAMPVAGLTGLALLDFVALSPEQRLPAGGWALALVGAAALATLIYAAGG